MAQTDNNDIGWIKSQKIKNYAAIHIHTKHTCMFCVHVCVLGSSDATYLEVSWFL